MIHKNRGENPLDLLLVSLILCGGAVGVCGGFVDWRGDDLTIITAWRGGVCNLWDGLGWKMGQDSFPMDLCSHSFAGSSTMFHPTCRNERHQGDQGDGAGRKRWENWDCWKEQVQGDLIVA